MKKPHIYTIVVNKRKKTLVIVVALAMALGIALAQLSDTPTGGMYSNFIKHSCRNILNSAPSARKKSQKGIYTGSLLSLCSPVFTGKGEIITVFNPMNADNPSAQNLDNDVKPKANTSEKDIEEKSVTADKMSIINATKYSINPIELVKKNTVYDAKGDTPKVLIMHTHGCETYSGENGIGLGESGTYRTADTEKNVVKIGEMLTDALKKAGIAAVHDKTLCDTPSYNKSYINAMTLIEKYKTQYPSVSFIFDIHRDAVTKDDGAPVKLVYEHDGKKAAQAMIVCGTDAMGLHHPDWQENLTLGLKIQQALQNKYPGFMRPLNLRQERFNMHETKGSLIFEIGTHGNTLEEAKRSVEYLTEGIVEVIGNF